MQFVKTEDLRPGMRIAKPIYNKMGVLLYDRDTELTPQGINSVENFGLIGIFILEPAEPLPPITTEELEFEQAQTIYMFKLKELMDHIQKERSINPITDLAQNIHLRYGSVDHKLHFTQNLRSSVDYVYKHSISVAILCVLIANNLRLPSDTMISLISAALLYDFGYLFVPHSILEKGEDTDDDDNKIIQLNLEKGYETLKPHASELNLSETALSLIQHAAHKKYKIEGSSSTLQLLLHILHVADKFDHMTAMNINKAPISELTAMTYLKEHGDIYNPLVVNALSNSIHILPTGACLDLNTGGKALVLQDNPHDFSHPMILSFEDNQLYDLSDEEVREKIDIQDIMKTMDNRIKIDEEALKQFVADDHTKEMVTHFREKKLLLAKRRNEREQRQEALARLKGSN